MSVLPYHFMIATRYNLVCLYTGSYNFNNLPLRVFVPVWQHKILYRKKGAITITQRYFSSIILSVIILLFAADTGYCQFTGYARRTFGMTGYLSLGLNRIETGSLNNDLEMNGYPVFSDLFGAWGGGMHAVIRNRLVIGMSYHRQMGRIAALPAPISISISVSELSWVNCSVGSYFSSFILRARK